MILSTLINIKEAVFNLLEKGVGKSKEQSLHIVQKSELCMRSFEDVSYQYYPLSCGSSSCPGLVLGAWDLGHFFCLVYTHDRSTVGPPLAKRPKTLQASATPPVCSRAPSELALQPLRNAEPVPAYYHWMALLLQEKFGGFLGLQFKLDDVDINVPPTSLDNAVQQLKEVQF